MNPRSINPLLFIGLIGFFTIGSQFFVHMYTAFFSDRDIYWTHQEMKLPIEAVGNEFQVFISGKTLQQHLSDRTLFAIDGHGATYVVAAKDVTARLNNWCEVRTRALIVSIFMGLGFAVCLTLLIVGLVQTIVGRNNRTADSALP